VARTINFNVSYPDGTAWIGVRVPFQLYGDDYTSTTQYPSAIVYSSQTDSNGDASVDLWQNEEGSGDSFYVCTLPTGETFRFTVPTGTTDLELGDLRAAYG
jgi:hypothetical protein